MTDGYWMYADPRQAASVAPPPAGLASLKRPRLDYGDTPGAPEMHAYYVRDEERTAPRVVTDTESINVSYDRYLRNGVPSYAGVEPGRPVIGIMSGRPVDDPRRPPVGYGSMRAEPPLPSDASNTLFIEGLPANCSRREASHIFRPFVGFQEVRLVNKESRHLGGDALVLCFVDFATARQAAIALDALQGYKFDEHDRESARLRLQFARFPGPRSSAGPRGRR